MTQSLAVLEQGLQAAFVALAFAVWIASVLAGLGWLVMQVVEVTRWARRIERQAELGARAHQYLLQATRAQVAPAPPSLDSRGSAPAPEAVPCSATRNTPDSPEPPAPLGAPPSKSSFTRR